MWKDCSWRNRLAQLVVLLSGNILLSGFLYDIRVGTVKGRETELINYVKVVALQDYRLRIKVIEFDDYNSSNTALNIGGVDANICQSQVHLEHAIRKNGYPFVAIGQTFKYPMVIYANRKTDLKQIKPFSCVGLPKDPVSQSRALRLLARAKLIKLDMAAKSLVTPTAIRHNPKQLRLIPMDKQALSQALEHKVDLVIANVSDEVDMNVRQNCYVLYQEPLKDAQAHLIVVKKQNRFNRKLRALVLACHDEEVTAYAKQLFEGQVALGIRGGEGGIRTRGRL